LWCFLPLRVTFVRQMSPLLSGLMCGTVVVLSMKLHSYFASIRNMSNKHKLLAIEWNKFVYFMMAPTLVFELEYPRTKKRRYWWLINKFIQCFLCSALNYALLQQFLLPILRDCDLDSLSMYDIIRLSIPSMIIWLIGFYGFFHCFLNGVAELTCFADRRFYQDWWNAPTLDIFWRKWNCLVHEWLLRHIYLESIHTAKTTKITATLLTFLYSAVIHELIFSVSFRVLRPWLFLAMFAQIPMIYLSGVLYEKLDANHRDRWGNVFFWLSFFLGQPMVEILYFRAWYQNVGPDIFCFEKDPNLAWWLF